MYRHAMTTCCLMPWEDGTIAHKGKGGGGDERRVLVRAGPSFEAMLDPGFSVLTVPSGNMEYIADCICTILFGMMTRYGEDELDVDWDRVPLFVRKVGAHYHSANQYHNFFHALCVIRETAYLFCNSGGADVRWRKGLFAMLVSALIHDIDHPGTNNDYEVKTDSHLARLYKDARAGVLECHHLDFALTLLQQEEVDVFHRWPEELRRKLELVLRDAVLATDMAMHKSLTEELQRRAQQPSPFDFSVFEERATYIKLLLHGADIFNAARPFAVCERIAEQVVAEFTAQVELERSQGLPSAPFMVIESDLAFCKGEKGFAQFVARPYFAALAACFPDKEALGQIVAQIDANIEGWQRKIDVLEARVLPP